MRPFNFNIEPETLEKLRCMASDLRMSVGQLIRETMEDLVERSVDVDNARVSVIAISGPVHVTKVN